MQLLPPQIEALRSVQSLMLTAYSTMSGIVGQSERWAPMPAPWGGLRRREDGGFSTCRARRSTTLISSAL